MFFISSLKLLCRSSSVSELIALFNTAMLSPNLLMLLKEHGVNKISIQEVVLLLHHGSYV